MMRSLPLVSLLRRYDIRYDPKSHRLAAKVTLSTLPPKLPLVTDNENFKDDERDGHNVTLKEIEALRKRVPWQAPQLRGFRPK
ncbi:hypothetical protein HRG_012759 [Hirsutella rhossiliensis]